MINNWCELVNDSSFYELFHDSHHPITIWMEWLTSFYIAGRANDLYYCF